MKRGARGLAFALGSALAFALMGWCVRLAGDHVPPPEVAFGRGLIGCVVLLPLVGRRVTVLFTRRSLWLWVRSIAGAAAVLSFFWTVHESSVASSRALTDLAPAFVVLLAWLCRTEPPRLTLCLVILAMTGSAVLLNLDASSGVSSLVLGVGLFGAFCASIAYHALRQAAQTFSSRLVVFGLALAMTLAAPLAPSEPWVIPDTRGMALIVGVGGLGILGQIWMTRAYVELSAAVASALGTTALLWSVLIDVVFQGRTLTVGAAIAYAVIAAGAASIHWIERSGSSAYPARTKRTVGASA